MAGGRDAASPEAALSGELARTSAQLLDTAALMVAAVPAPGQWPAGRRTFASAALRMGAALAEVGGAVATVGWAARCHAELLASVEARTRRASDLHRYARWLLAVARVAPVPARQRVARRAVLAAAGATRLAADATEAAVRGPDLVRTRVAAATALAAAAVCTVACPATFDALCVLTAQSAQARELAAAQG